MTQPSFSSAPQTWTSAAPASEVTPATDRPRNPPQVVGRHARALRILTCLQAGPAFNAKELAKHLNVSRRTIYRDMNLIRDAGIPVHYDERQAAYRLVRDRHQHITPELEHADLSNLLVAAQLSLAHGLPIYEQKAQDAMHKLMCHFPSPVRAEVSRMLSGLTVELPKIPMSERASRALAAILQAIGRSVQVRIVYYRFGRLQTIHLEPHRVELSVDCRRLIGRSPQYRQRQRLELEDIVRVDLTDRTFVPPCGFRLGFGRR